MPRHHPHTPCPLASSGTQLHSITTFPTVLALSGDKDLPSLPPYTRSGSDPQGLSQALESPDRAP